MKTYIVTRPIHGIQTLIVNAESGLDAKRKVDMYNYQSLDNPDGVETSDWSIEKYSKATTATIDEIRTT